MLPNWIDPALPYIFVLIPIIIASAIGYWLTKI